MAKDSELARQWLAVVKNSERGEIFLCNLACDLATDRISSIDLDIFLACVTDPAVTDPTLPSRGDAFACIDVATVKADLVGKGPTPADVPDVLATIKRFNRAFVDQYFDLRHFHGVASYHDARSLFEALGLTDFSKGARAGMKLSGQKDLVWLTRADIVQAIVADLEAKGRTNDIPARVRDFLGLSHHATDEFLVQILVPKEALASIKLSRPLSFDAGANLIFRTDTVKRSYGYAVDLASLGEGAYELVSGPIPIQARLQLIALGRVNQSPPALKWSAVWSDHNAVQRERDALFDEIDRLLNTW